MPTPTKSSQSKSTGSSSSAGDRYFSSLCAPRAMPATAAAAAAAGSEACSWAHARAKFRHCIAA